MTTLRIVLEVGEHDIIGKAKELQAKANEIMASQRRFIEIEKGKWIENNHIVAMYLLGDCGE